VAIQRPQGDGCFAWTTIYHQGAKHPFVYIMASRRNGTLYVGVTSDLARRVSEHREGTIAGFTRRYGCKLLVWMEPRERIDEAIAREKQIKAGSREDKLALIERDNPLWNDLYEILNG
jgi:putative endonuclease